MTLAGCSLFSSKKDGAMREYTNNTHDVINLFPKNVAEITANQERAMERARMQIADIIAVPDAQRTYDNTFGAYDRAAGHFGVASIRNGLLHHVSPDAALRDASQQSSIAMSEFSVDLFGHNVPLYNALKYYAAHNASNEELTPDQRYFIKETLDGLKRAGLELPEDKQQQIKALLKELSVLSTDFSKNIADDNRTITVSRQELRGLDDDFIGALKKTDDGRFVVGIDYPTYFAVMEFCEDAGTRKKLYDLFLNRAYPVNKDILESIIAKRDALAKLLGYHSYAQLNLESEMAKTPERAQEFISSLLPKAQEKMRQEFANLTRNLPESVQLTADGKLQPWDTKFLTSYYKKKHYDLDERVVSEYFPTETTIQGLLKIYEAFFSLDMRHEKVSGLWHDDVSLVKVYRKGTDDLIGYLFLDLHPRPNKYSHACQVTIVPATKNNDNSVNPAVAVVIANFPRSTESKPSLLKLTDVKTFFHEFGHAIHTILGATKIISCSGTNVKTDFVEMPSQMLEYWLHDRAILKMVSKHYQTGQPLPDNLIDTIIDIKNFTAGFTVAGQLTYAQISLDVYGIGSSKDLDALVGDIYARSLPVVAGDKDNHMYAGFGHLTGYGAGYYGYMWSNVFAADLFYYIKPQGLLNPEIGLVYAEKILAPGGSVDPNELLRNFLGREPNDQAFMKDYGL